jgi:hypothetical protein
MCLWASAQSALACDDMPTVSPHELAIMVGEQATFTVTGKCQDNSHTPPQWKFVDCTIAPNDGGVEVITPADTAWSNPTKTFTKEVTVKGLKPGTYDIKFNLLSTLDDGTKTTKHTSHSVKLIVVNGAGAINVVVKVSPTLATVKPNEEVQYTLTASYVRAQPLNAGETEEVEYQLTHVLSAPAGCTLTPAAPGLAAWNASDTRTITAKASAVGEYLLSFVMSVRIKVKNAGGVVIRTDVYSGRGLAKLKVTDGKFKIELNFDDNFADRSLFRMGVGEGAVITASPMNVGDVLSGITYSGSGSISVSGNRITAGESGGSGTITVRASVVGSQETYTETLGVYVVEPAGVQFIRIGQGLLFLPTDRGVSFLAALYLRPTDVSFRGVLIGEEGDYDGKTTLVDNNIIERIKAERTGSLQNITHEYHLAWAMPGQSGNIYQGCRVGANVNGGDLVGFKWYNIPGDGSYIWHAIPWTYQTGTMNLPKIFTTLIQDMRNIGNQKSTVSKNGVTAERIMP